MKPQSTLKKLQEVESHYERLLTGVRALIAIENGQPIAEPKSNSRNGDTPPTAKPFAKMTKADAVTTILKEKGQMHSSKIYNSMRKRGHPIASKNSLANLLSTDKRFEKKGKGIWALAEAQ